MKYLLPIFIFFGAFSAYCADEQPTQSELRRKTTTELRKLIEEAYGDLKDANQKTVNAENQLSLAEMSLDQSKANYDDLYNNQYIPQINRANEAVDKLYQAEIKAAELKKSNFILKSFMAVAVGIIAFIVTSNFMNWATFPLNWIGPFAMAAGAGALIFFIF